MRGKGDRCVALRGTIGRSARCSIYQRRPGVCSKFKVGSEQCSEMRRRVGLSKITGAWRTYEDESGVLRAVWEWST